jgi:flagellar secretion chaperone FliS
MTSAHRAISAYVETGLETGVAEAGPHRLISMLFDGAILAIAEASIRLARGEIAERGQAISKAITIVDEGLRESLDFTQGGELAERLDVLYRYISSQLLTANLRANAEPLMEADRLLTQLQDAWKVIGESQQIKEMAHAANV